MEFNISQVYDICFHNNRWCIEGYPNDYVIDTTTIQPADDPSKAMLETLRQRLLLESRPVLNDAYDGMLYLSDVNAILDEMEAKL